MREVLPALALTLEDDPVFFRSQGVEDWCGPFELPATVTEYFAELGPLDVELEMKGNPLVLPSLSRLWETQTGYRVGLGGEDLPGWRDEWLVIAREGADPCIMDMQTGRISYAMAGMGEWDPDPVADSLVSFVKLIPTLSSVGSVVPWEFCGAVPRRVRSLINAHYRRRTSRLRG